MGRHPGGRPAKPVDRIWSWAVLTDDCWNWTGGKDPDGYGIFRVNGKSRRAHRVAWGQIYGKIPRGLRVLHHCDNPSCINPEHLFLGTDQDNVLDAFSKGRRFGPKGEKHGRSKLTDSQVLKIKRRLSSGELHKAIARDFGVRRQTISLIAEGKTWRHIG